MKDELTNDLTKEVESAEKRYKYLYEIKQTNPKPGEAIYYRGSRTSKLPPEQDFWIKYFTSSKLVARKIEESGKDTFEVVEIKHLPENCNIQYEEHLYLIEVDARNNPLYFNQTNNDGFDNPESSLRVCPHCYHKNYGNPFENCSNCGEVMIIYNCKRCNSIIPGSASRCEKCGYSMLDNANYTCDKCGNQLNNPTERCSCGYSKMDDIIHKCLKCDNELNAPTQRCSCGYSRFDDIEYTCDKCGIQLKTPSERCSCGYSKVDDTIHKCIKCGSQIKTPASRCVCGYSRMDDAKFTCAKCGSLLKGAIERCSCGHSRMDDFKYRCEKCGGELKNLNERCRCGYSRIYDTKFTCAKCGSQLKTPATRCSCGYSRMDDAKIICDKCGNKLKSSNERCSCGYSKVDDAKYICYKCGSKLKSSGAQCSQCQITHAGYKNWKKYNPIYKLILNERVVFRGYRHLCVKFMVDELICDKESAKKWLKGDLAILSPNQPSKKYPNKIKYAGLRAELIPYSGDNDDLDK